MCHTGRMTLRNSKMWVLRLHRLLNLDLLLRLFFLNKLAACYFAKYLCVSEMRKQTHAKSHEKIWDLAWHLVECNVSNDLIISE